MTREASSPALRLIALYKLAKAAVLLAVGLGALRLVHADLGALARQWLEPIAMDSTRDLVDRIVAAASGLSPRGLEVIAVGAFLYAALYTVEGVGLWMEKRWAELLVVFTTLLFVPVEVYALTRRVTLPRMLGLALNVLVAAYLIWALRRERRDRQRGSRGGPR